MPGNGPNAPKKRNKGKVIESDQRTYSFNDAYTLFGAPFIASLPDNQSDMLIN